VSWFQKPRENGGDSAVNLNVPPLPVGYATCDRCSATAFVRVVVDSVKQHWLDFCVHHFRQHEPALITGGYAVEDQSKQCGR
jgi:hypothetical protein